MRPFAYGGPSCRTNLRPAAPALANLLVEAAFPSSARAPAAQPSAGSPSSGSRCAAGSACLSSRPWVSHYSSGLSLHSECFRADPVWRRCSSLKYMSILGRRALDMTRTSTSARLRCVHTKGRRVGAGPLRCCAAVLRLRRQMRAGLRPGQYVLATSVSGRAGVRRDLDLERSRVVREGSRRSLPGTAARPPASASGSGCRSRNAAPLPIRPISAPDAPLATGAPGASTPARPLTPMAGLPSVRCGPRPTR